MGTQVNNPCNVGFHVTTNAEITAVFTSYSITNSATAFSNGPTAGGGFKFVLAGYRDVTGSFGSVGVKGYYWSSTVNGTISGSRIISAGNSNSSTFYRAYGLSVRCFKYLSFF